MTKRDPLAGGPVSPTKGEDGHEGGTTGGTGIGRRLAGPVVEEPGGQGHGNRARPPVPSPPSTTTRGFSVGGEGHGTGSAVLTNITPKGFPAGSRLGLLDDAFEGGPEGAGGVVLALILDVGNDTRQG
jgi:hypothetical protein